jgi:hypothetical protein
MCSIKSATLHQGIETTISPAWLHTKSNRTKKEFGYCIKEVNAYTALPLFSVKNKLFFRKIIK